MKYLFTLFALLSLHTLTAQRAPRLPIVEVSGIVVTMDRNDVVPASFVSISLKDRSRGTYANLNGQFTLVVRQGDTLVVSGLGYAPTEYVVPTNIQSMYYSVTLQIESQPLDMPNVLVFPWPDRDHFKIEFLAMNPTQAQQLQDVAEKNLQTNRMLHMAKQMEMEESENADYYLRQQARDYSYRGQIKPMPVYSPLAWKQFFQSLKKGDLKKQENYSKDEESVEDIPDINP